MPNLTASIPHQLTRAEAKRRIQDGLSEMRRQQAAMLGGLRETWHGDAMVLDGAVMGQHVSGRIDVRDREVFVEVAVPALLSALAAALTPMIEQHGRRLLTGPAPK